MNPFGIFTRTKADLQEPAPHAPKANGSAINGTEAHIEDAPKRVTVSAMSGDALKWQTPAENLGFETTKDIEPSYEVVGQDDVMEELDAALNAKGRNQNIIVVAPAGTDLRDALLRRLKLKAAAEKPVSQWIYVTDFDHPAQLKALKLPFGYGHQLRAELDEAIDALREDIPAALENENYRLRLEVINDTYSANREKGVNALIDRAREQGIAVLRTPTGYSMAPMLEGKVVKSDVFSKLPPSMQSDVEQRIRLLQDELMLVLQTAPRTERERRQQAAKLREEAVSAVVHDTFEPLCQKFSSLPEVLEFLSACQRDIVRNTGTFMNARGQGTHILAPISISNDLAFARYRVTVLDGGRDEDAQSVPVIYETNPTPQRLVGKILMSDVSASMQHDPTRIAAGVLHKANGGYLVLDAEAVLQCPGSWPALKAVLLTGQIGFSEATSLNPESVPLTAKIVLVGQQEQLAKLQGNDMSLMEWFGHRVELHDQLIHSDDSQMAFARHIAGVVAKKNLRPFNAAAVALIIDEARRKSGSRDQLSANVAALAGIARRADNMAKKAGRDTVDAEDVRKAITQLSLPTNGRSGTTRANGDNLSRWINGNAVVGQVLTLSHRGGSDPRPAISCVTANTFPSSAPRLDVVSNASFQDDRARAVASKLHSFLSANFTNGTINEVSATVSVEAPHTTDSTIDIDSTSLAQLIALLSSLSNWPIPQSIAVVGQIGHSGRLRRVSETSALIEHYFALCEHSNSKGPRGVIVPYEESENLMLSSSVIEEVEAERFKIWPISDVAEGISLLSSLAADEIDSAGTFTDKNASMVRDRLLVLAQQGARHTTTNGADALNGAAP